MEKIVTSLFLVLFICFNQIKAAPQDKEGLTRDLYHFKYGSVDSRSETGKLKEINGEKSIVVTGVYEFVYDREDIPHGFQGKMIRVEYVADENGFHPKISYSRFAVLASAAMIATLSG